MLNKNARNNKTSIKSQQFLGRKQAQGCICEEGGVKVVVCKNGWVREGWYYMYLHV